MKYKLTEATEVVAGVTVHRIQALKSFGDVTKGDLGGWVASEDNLSQAGLCWVYRNAFVYGDAGVSGNAGVFEDARVFGNARVYGNAQVSGEARVFEKARVYGNVRVFGNVRVYGDAEVFGYAWMSEGVITSGEYKQ